MTNHHRKKKQTAGILFFLTIAIIVGIVFYPRLAKQIPFLKKTVQTPSERISEKKEPTAAVMKVGEELIYQQDFDFEKSQYPPVQGVDINKLLVDKIITDSIILQAAKADGVITLDNSVFNSKNKNYLNRVKLIKQIKKTINEKSDSISGSYVTIWFFNDVAPKIGLEKAKQIALEKITKIHADVKVGKLTMKEAGEVIAKDNSLEDIDPAHASNAYYEFTKKTNEKFSTDPKIDALVSSLKEGEISDVYLAKATPFTLGKETEALYKFIQVDKKISSGKFTGFEDWLSQKKKLYEVIYY